MDVQAEKGSNSYVVRIHLQPPALMSQFVQNSLECEVISNPSNRAIPYVVGKNSQRKFYKMKREREETGAADVLGASGKEPSWNRHMAAHSYSSDFGRFRRKTDEKREGIDPEFGCCIAVKKERKLYSCVGGSRNASGQSARRGRYREKDTAWGNMHKDKSEG